MKVPLITLATLSLSAAAASAQPKLPGRWSLMLQGDWDIAMADMRGTLADFHQQFLFDFTTDKYPFGDDKATSFGAGASLAYRFPESPLSLYSGPSLHVFSVQDKSNFNASTDAMALAMVMLSVGGEYIAGPTDGPLNGYARFGMNVNFITGYIVYGTTNISSIALATRGGVEAELGMRYTFPVVPFSLEGGITYINANLIGKSYSAPPSGGLGSVVKERGLNDDADPANSADHPRVIAVLLPHIGVRLWF